MRDLIEALNRAHKLDEARSIKEERSKPDAVLDASTPFHNLAIANALGIRVEDILWEIEPNGFSVNPDFKDYIVRDVNGNSYNVRVMGPRRKHRNPYAEAALRSGVDTVEDPNRAHRLDEAVYKKRISEDFRQVGSYPYMYVSEDPEVDYSEEICNKYNWDEMFDRWKSNPRSVPKELWLSSKAVVTKEDGW
jgi:hypothetical protein